jgi:hypothetical protein
MAPGRSSALILGSAPRPITADPIAITAKQHPGRNIPRDADATMLMRESVIAWMRVGNSSLPSDGPSETAGHFSRMCVLLEHREESG